MIKNNGVLDVVCPKGCRKWDMLVLDKDRALCLDCGYITGGVGSILKPEVPVESQGQRTLRFFIKALVREI